MLSESGDPRPATDTFALLSNEIRLDIVRTLAAATGPLRFSEIQARTGIRDGGQFNYHLQKLRGQLVEKTPDGYVLTDAGERAGTLLPERAGEP